jgi:transmembrane sensor
MENDDWTHIDDEQGAKLARYVSGRCTPAEEAEVRVWLQADPSRADLAESLRQVWSLSQRTRRAWDVDVAWTELQALRETRAAAPLPRQSRFQWRVPSGLVRAAAVIALLLGGGVIWSHTYKQYLELPRVVAMHEHQTRSGERAEIRLTDGTRVVLNVGSRLSVPENYGKRARDVYLEGEALFEVEHNERRPFRVQANGVVAEDLGTVFGVRAYADATSIIVAVAEGVVDVKATASRSDTVRLNANQLARVSGDSVVEVDRDIDPADYLAFAEGRLVFRDTPLKDAAAQLARWYRVDVRLADSALVARPLTASFHNEPLSRVVNLIALSLDLRFERDGNVVTFYR